MILLPTPYLTYSANFDGIRRRITSAPIATNNRDYVETFNRKRRDEPFNRKLLSIGLIRYVAEGPRMDYNHGRSHGRLDYLAPAYLNWMTH